LSYKHKKKKKKKKKKIFWNKKKKKKKKKNEKKSNKQFENDLTILGIAFHIFMYLSYYSFSFYFFTEMK